MSRIKYVIDPTQLNEDTGLMGKLVPASEYVRPHSDGRVMVMTDLYMDGVAATDGTDIGSRRKRRDYMQRNNLADADDFRGTWEKASREREARMSGHDDSRTQDVVRALRTQRGRR